MKLISVQSIFSNLICAIADLIGLDALVNNPIVVFALSGDFHIPDKHYDRLMALLISKSYVNFFKKKENTSIY